MVLKPVRPNWIERRCRIRDRRDASIIKNNNALKRMGTGKGNWGTELDAQMTFEELGLDLEMETVELGPEIIAMSSLELKSKQAETDAKGADEEKPKEAKMQKNRKGYQILEFTRNFELRPSEKKVEVAKENKDPATGKTEEKKVSGKPPAAEGKDSGAEVKLSVKMPDTKELQKAAALRFKKKGPVWGIEPKEQKEVKSCPIKEELKKSQSKGK